MTIIMQFQEFLFRWITPADYGKLLTEAALLVDTIRMQLTKQ